MDKKSASPARVDEQVYLTMAALCVVALLVLAFRYGTSHPCQPIKIVTDAIYFTEGSQIGFKAETNGGSTFGWNFGDGGKTEEYTPTTRHKFDNAGRYTVSVTVDGQCTEMQNIVITPAHVMQNMSLLPSISGSDTAYVGKAAIFEDQTLTSKSWKWFFEDASTVNQTGRRASHIYLTPGNKRIILEVNDRPDLTTEYQVFVIDKQAQANAARPRTETPKPRVTLIPIPDKPTVDPLTNNNPPPEKPKEEEKPKVPSASDAELSAMLMQVVEGSKAASDFSGYLCNNLSIPVIYNGNKVTFAAMCEQLKGLKRKRVKNIQVIQTKTEPSNCIGTMTVTLDKKKWPF